MGRPYLGPYLRIHGGRGLKSQWMIVDRNRSKALGLPPEDIEAAEAALAKFREEGGYFPPLPERVRRVIYFISTNDVQDYPVKIGLTNASQPDRRIASLQISCPYELVTLAALEVILSGEEGRFHRRFAKSRMIGEWFAGTPELMRLIDHINAGEYDPFEGAAFDLNASPYNERT